MLAFLEGTVNVASQYCVLLNFAAFLIAIFASQSINSFFLSITVILACNGMVFWTKDAFSQLENAWSGDTYAYQAACSSTIMVVYILTIFILPKLHINQKIKPGFSADVVVYSSMALAIIHGVYFVLVQVLELSNLERYYDVLIASINVFVAVLMLAMPLVMLLWQFSFNRTSKEKLTWNI